MYKFVLALSIAFFVFVGPAQAQSKKELAQQDLELAERISVLESRLLTGDPAAERLMQRIDALEASQRTLTGEVERLRFERDNLRAEVAALGDDVRELQELSTRMKIHLDAVDLIAQEQAARRAPTIYDGSPNAFSNQSNTIDYGQPSSIPDAPVFREQTIGVQQNYNDLSELPDKAKQKLAEGDFIGAQTDFRTYLDNLPDAPDAGEISYWLGESYYVTQSYADAADSYINSMRKDPNGVKAPDAMVKLAAALRELGKTTEACQTLDSFPAQYPNAADHVRNRARTELARTGC